MQIKRIEKEIRDTPYHKGTEHHIGRLRARLAKFKDALEYKQAAGGGGGGYAVKKQGDATVVLVGPPSAGKSTLLNKLTNARSKVAPYSFTTVTVVPGMMEYKNARIQILDVPGLIEGAEEGKGRGREVLSVVRGADLLILMSDLERPQALTRIVAALERNGIRINKSRPRVRVEKKTKGGLMVKSNIKQEMEKETIKEIAREMGVKNGEIMIDEKLTLDELVDALSKNRAYVNAMMILNKGDLGMAKTVGVDLVISAESDAGLAELREMMWQSLGFVRIYLVRSDEAPSMNNPLIVKQDEDLLAVAEKIGSDFLEDKKRAKIWGAGAKFPGQEVSLTTKVREGMQIRFV